MANEEERHSTNGGPSTTSNNKENEKSVKSSLAQIKSIGDDPEADMKNLLGYLN